MKCCICDKDIPAVLDAKGNILRDDAHNAHPVAEGQCCETCNYTVVLPKRMELSSGRASKTPDSIRCIEENNRIINKILNTKDDNQVGDATKELLTHLKKYNESVINLEKKK